MLARIAGVVGILGIFLAYYGFQEFRVGSGSTTEPVAMALPDLETGKALTSNHLQLGEHYALYTDAVYSYSQRKDDHSAPGPTTRVQYAYYPVLSQNHPFMQELRKFILEMASSPNGAATRHPPTIKEFKVLVKTNKFKTIGGIPDDFPLEPSLQGLVINRIHSLGKDEKNLIQQSFPQLDLTKVLILEEGRKPTSSLLALGMVLGGIVVAAGGGIGFWLGMTGDS